MLQFTFFAKLHKRVKSSIKQKPDSRLLTSTSSRRDPVPVMSYSMWIPDASSYCTWHKVAVVRPISSLWHTAPKENLIIPSDALLVHVLYLSRLHVDQLSTRTSAAENMFHSTAWAAEKVRIYAEDVRVKSESPITSESHSWKVNLMNQDITDRQAEQENVSGRLGAVITFPFTCITGKEAPCTSPGWWGIIICDVRTFKGED